MESYPLCWPEGYPRSRIPLRSKFESNRKSGLTIYRARVQLENEIKLLRGDAVIISTNMRTRLDGEICSNAKEPDDSGVAVYFKIKGRPVVLCCDKWRSVKENLRAITLTISAMRGMDRWGVSQMLDRIFTGFIALPEPDPPWWAVLGISSDASRDEIKKAYRETMMINHPDIGGNQERAAQVNHAYKTAMAGNNE